MGGRFGFVRLARRNVRSWRDDAMMLGMVGKLGKESHDVAALYRRFAPMVLRRAQRFLSNSDAEELVQEVFLKLVENPAAFRGESSPATWLYTVATRLCLDRLRDGTRRRELIAEHGPAVLTPTDVAGQPETRVFLTSLWRTLEPGLAMVGILYYVDGLTTADIGATLGVTDRAIAKRLDALKLIARRAAGLEPEPGGGA